MMVSVTIRSGGVCWAFARPRRVARRHDLVLLALENRLEKIENGLAVVDEQNAAHGDGVVSGVFGRLPEVKM